RAEIVRAAAARRRLAQALHQPDISGAARPAPRRFVRKPSDGGRQWRCDRAHPRRGRDRAGPQGRGRAAGRAMSDSIFVAGLALHAYHGVMQHEAKVGQTFKLDLTLDIDLAAAARTDKLAHTVSYDQVVETVSRIFCGRRYRLVEAAAGAVADAILERFAQ